MPRNPHAGKIRLLLILAMSLSCLAQGATWYVSPDGSDANDATLVAPFATVGHAIWQTSPGDTVYLRGGLYTESTISPVKGGLAGSPLTIAAYTPPGGEPEIPVLTGFTQLTPGSGGVGIWQNHTGNIFKINLGRAPTITRGWQLFMVDGQVLTEASWPDRVGVAGFDYREMAQADSGTIDTSTAYPTYGFSSDLYEGTYTDSDLPALPDDAWAGARIDLTPGHGWWWKTGIVTSSSGSTLTFRFPYTIGWPGHDIPSGGDPYFIFDSLLALDSAGEAFFDFEGRFGAANTLYVWMPDSSDPGGLPVYIRDRTHALDIKNKSYIHFEDLHFLAASINTNSNCQNLTFRRLELLHSAYNIDTVMGGEAKAIYLWGNGHTVEDCRIHQNYGLGIFVRGSNYVIRNNVIHDNASSGIATAYTTAPEPTPSGHLVEENTIFRSGNTTMDIGAASTRYLKNHFYHNGMRITDVALANTFDSGDANGTEIAYNWIHSSLARYDLSRNWYGGQGIRLDGGGAAEGCSNYLIHHNIVWNITSQSGITFWGLTPSHLNYGNAQIYVYNNTSINPIVVNGVGSAAGSVIQNNIGSEFINYASDLTGATITDNLFEATSLTGNLSGRPEYVSPNRFNLALRGGSRAIEAGAVIAGITNGYSGTAPDMGALESGNTRWLAGAKLREGDPEDLQFQAGFDSVAIPQLQITGLPVGRIFPQETIIRLKLNGSHYDQTELYHDFNLSTHKATAFAAFSGLTPGESYAVEVSLDGTVFIDTGSVVSLPSHSLGMVSPENVPTTGGTSLASSGNRAPAQNHVRIPVDIDLLVNDAARENSVPMQLDTASLIAQGVLEADGTNLSIHDRISGQDLDWARDGGWNGPSTLLWFRFPEGIPMPASFSHGVEPLVEIRMEQAAARYPFTELPDASAIRGTWPPAANKPMAHVHTPDRKDPPILTLATSPLHGWYLDASGELQVTTPALPDVSLPYWQTMELGWPAGPAFAASSPLLLYTPAYGAWAAAAFPAETPPQATEPEADPDADGMPNFAEFALGHNPLVYDGADRQSLDGDQFNFRINKAATDVLISMEMSDDLSVWQKHQLQDIGLSLFNPDPDGTGTFNEWTVTLPEHGNRVFVRLKLDRL